MSARGRPKKSGLWKHFTTREENGKLVAVCKYCSQTYANNTVRMEKHILQNCKSIPDITRENYAKVHVSKPEESSSDSDDAQRVTNSAGAQTQRGLLFQEPVKKVPKITQKSPSLTKPVRSLSSLSSWIDDMGNKEREKLDRQLMKAVVAGNCPLGLAEHPEWKKFFKMIRPAYDPPSRKKMSTTLLDDLFDEVKARVDGEVAAADWVSMSSDGWSDVNMTPLINFMFYTGQDIYILDYEDTGDNPHTGEYIFQQTRKRIDQVGVGAERVVALVTDNAANMKAAWVLLQAEYPWITCYGCVAHGLNLLANDFLKLLKNTFRDTAIVINFFRNHQVPSQALKKKLKEKKINCTLKRHAVTCWASHHEEFVSLIKCKSALQETVFSEKIAEHATLSKALKDVKEMVTGEIFWDKVVATADLLRPIAKALVEVQGNVQLARIPGILESVKTSVMEAIPLAPVSVASEDALREKMMARIEFCSHEMQWAASILHPSIKGNALTEDQTERAVSYLASASETFPTLKDSSTEILADLLKYRAGHAPFNSKIAIKMADNVDALTWWEGCFPTSPLTKLAKVLLTAPATTAATERNWSIRGAIHTKERNRLLTTRASKLTYVKHNLNLFNIKPPARAPAGDEECSTSRAVNVEGAAALDEDEDIYLESSDNDTNDEFEVAQEMGDEDIEVESDDEYRC